MRFSGRPDLLVRVQLGDSGCEVGQTLSGEAKVGNTQDLVGRTFSGRYRITQRIGKGGMSVVYKAVHTGTNKVVALKVLASDISGDEKQVLRFEQEAKASSRLRHANIIRVFDYGRSEDGLLFIAMELLEGLTIGDMIKRDGPVSPARTCRILSQVCEALAEAHNQGIIHRDLKPDNVFRPDRVPAGQAADFIKLLDFGIAKVVGEQGYETLTQTGFICGTPLYISPEQSLGMQLDGRADLYSVGVLMFELLAGRTPFVADSPIALVMKHIHNEPPKLAHVNPSVEVPKAMRDLMHSMLSKDRDERPRSAREVIRRLGEIEQNCEGLPAATRLGGAPEPVPVTSRPTRPPKIGNTSDQEMTRMMPAATARPARSAQPAVSARMARSARPASSAMPADLTGDIPVGEIGESRKFPALLVFGSLAALLVVGATVFVLLKFVPFGETLHESGGTVSAGAENPPGQTTRGTRTNTERSSGAEKPAKTTNRLVRRPALAASVGRRVTTAEFVAFVADPTELTESGARLEARVDRRLRRAVDAADTANVAAAPGTTEAPSARVFTIETVPAGARVTVRGKPEGKTPYRFEASDKTPATTVIVSRRGYLPETWQYHPGAAPPPGQDRVKLVLKKRKRTPRKRQVKWEE
ncbi:MAG: serine/threonine protein kinase [Myxococcota bacterium]|jgi:serine/threonine protein kinase